MLPAVSPVYADRHLPVWIGVDASVKRDSTALVACTWDDGAKKVRIVAHRVFKPTPGDPLDFEGTVEETLLDWRRRYSVREIRYDPYQMAALSQRLVVQRLPMIEFPQTSANLTAASTCLYELIVGRNLIAYADPDIRLAVQRAVAVESSRGWRLAKEKASHHIDVVIALALAAYGAVQESTAAPSLIQREDVGSEEVDEEPEPRLVDRVYSVLLIAPDGYAGLAYFCGPRPHVLAPLWLLDFEMTRLGPSLFTDIATRLDDIAEDFWHRKPTPVPVNVVALSSAPYDRRMDEAITTVFTPRIKGRPERRSIAVSSIEAAVTDQRLLSDGVWLHHCGSVFWDRVKVSGAAKHRMVSLPLRIFNALGDIRDPVSAAVLLGVIMHYEVERSGDPNPRLPTARTVWA